LIRSRPTFIHRLENRLNIGIHAGQHTNTIGNPLSKPFPWWYELYQRIRLFPWWIKYNLGSNEESELKNKIIYLASEMNLEKKWIKKIIRHAVSEFSKKGLGSDYYGYHTIDHELEATYLTLVSIYGHIKQSNENTPIFTNKDIKYLFFSALFHDYDPVKQFDKPNEESVEWFLRNDPEIRKFIDILGLDINVVIAIIYRTAYPFYGKIADNATKRIQELLSIKDHSKEYDDGNNNKDANYSSTIGEHYLRLGWLLSVCERMAGYALGDFEHANKLARSNAHALGWHPSIINRESVKYFDILKQENEMLQFVLDGLPDNLRKNFFNNIHSFHDLYKEEKKIRKLARNGEIIFECNLEQIGNSHNNGRNSIIDLEIRNHVLNIYNKLPIPLKRGERDFISSLSNPDTILITLRLKREKRLYQNNSSTNKENDVLKDIDMTKEDNSYGKETIVGYVKGGSLEKYNLRRGTFDENYGKKNTVYMEWICIKPGYWGSTGGHLLRMSFLQEAKKRGYNFITGYVHRNVIMKRMDKGEIIEVVQKYDPDKLDYYRIDISKTLGNDSKEENEDKFATK
jgi:hypothetical protein